MCIFGKESFLHKILLKVAYRSADKTGADSALRSRKRDAGLSAGFNTGEQPGQVIGKGSHCLQSFQVLFDLIGSIAMDTVPILGGDHRHRGDREVFIELIKGRAGSSRRQLTTAAAGL